MRLCAQLFDEGLMRGKLFGAEFRRQRLRPPRQQGLGAARRPRQTAENQRRLAPAAQLGIDFGQNFGVEQGAVARAPRGVDAKARAERVEAVRGARKLPSRQRQRVDDAMAPNWLQIEPGQLGVEKAHVEFGVVRDDLGLIQKFDELG